MDSHLSMNIVDSIRELGVLTVAGVLVYKLEYLASIRKIRKATKCSKQEAELEALKTSMIHTTEREIKKIDKLEQEVHKDDSV